MRVQTRGRFSAIKRWVKRIGLGLLALLTLCVVGGFGFEQWSRWDAERRFPPIGTMVEVDGAQSHLYCVGEGTPTVILESGHDPGGSQSWITVQPEIARFTRVCSYDRAGVLWSESRPEPRDANTIARELGALLAAVGEAPPYVMVGHSLGGPYVRVFGAGPGKEAVVGFVFVDASHPEQRERAPTQIGGPQPPPIVLIRAFATLGLMRLSSSQGPENMPPGVHERISAFSPRSSPAMIAEYQALDASLAQAGAAGPLGDRPVVVLTGSERPPEARNVWFGEMG